MTLALTSLTIVAALCVVLLLLNCVAVAWLLLRGGLPLRIVRWRGHHSDAETELAELIAGGQRMSEVLHKVSEVVGDSRTSIGDLQSRFVRAVMTKSELIRKQQGRADTLAQSLIEIVDHIDVSLQLQEEDAPREHATDPVVRSGRSSILNQMQSMAINGLMRGGVRPMPLVVGQPFDSHGQRAMDRQNGDQPPDTILQVVQRGFVSGSGEDEFVLRPALVVVCAGPDEEPPPEAGAPADPAPSTSPKGDLP